MSSAIITALSTVFGAVISGIVAVVVAGKQHSKTVALIEYRLDAMEKKQDKHNQMIERVYELERKTEVHEEKIKVCNHRIEDLEEKR